MWSAAAWEPFADTLGQHYTLIIPDLPGHGYSTGLPATWSTKRVAEQMLQLLDHLQVERVRAIGCSAGANVLLHMALKAPDRLDGMMLISGSHRLTPEVRESLRSLPSMEDLGEWRAWNASHSPHGDGQVRALLQRLRGLADNYDDFSTPLADLRKISTPTLIATGDEDSGPSVETGLELHRNIPGSSLWVVNDAGHCPFWDETPGGSRHARALFPSVALTFLASQ
jgi:pimeloyl-ACP methyl ester carboxylesterase